MEDEPGEKKEEKKRKAANDDPEPPRKRWDVFEPELAQAMLNLKENERARVEVFVASIKVTDEEEALMSVVAHFLTEGLFARWGALKLKSLRTRFENEDLRFMIEDLRRSRCSFSDDQISAVSEEVGEAAALLVARVVRELPRFGNMANALATLLAEGMARLSPSMVFAAETWRVTVFWFVVVVLDPSVCDMEEEDDDDNEDDEDGERNDEDEDQGASAAAAAAVPPPCRPS